MIMITPIDYMNTQIVFDFRAKDELDIYQCLITLFTTPAGTVPLYRDFGIDITILDQPLNIARNKYSVELTEKVQRYEPRVKIKAFTFEYEELSGGMYPKVVVSRAQY
ncbi:MAG: hypothetical protein LBB94_03445 [Clostridiales bacterium]|jgi:phage baseplate assembly protein W|nr:hypothetical protein [Clostridiales bacterium]